MKLVPPSADLKGSFIEAVKEFQKDVDYTHRNQWYRKLVVPELETNFGSFVERELSHSRGENIPEGYVPYTDYWLVENNQYIGRASIRHKLNDHLMQIGGHIGYDIRPSMRGKGYGNKILELALEKVKDFGIRNVLITSDIRNITSRKIIEKCGGVLENQIPNPEMGFDALRYWINLQ